MFSTLDSFENLRDITYKVLNLERRTQLGLNKMAAIFNLYLWFQQQKPFHYFLCMQTDIINQMEIQTQVY